jgi:hypothetical protein
MAKLAGQRGASSNPIGFASPTGRRGQCRALAEPLCGVSDEEIEVLPLAKLADSEGFEPTVELPLRRISSAVLSTSQPPVQRYWSRALV